MYANSAMKLLPGSPTPQQTPTTTETEAGVVTSESPNA